MVIEPEARVHLTRASALVTGTHVTGNYGPGGSSMRTAAVGGER